MLTTNLKIMSIRGYRDVHPAAVDIEDGKAGVIYHAAGIGHVRVDLSNGDEIYVPGGHFLSFVVGYDKFGPGVLNKLVSVGEVVPVEKEQSDGESDS